VAGQVVLAVLITKNSRTYCMRGTVW
jgi:hypothetical protein